MVGLADDQLRPRHGIQHPLGDIAQVGSQGHLVPIARQSIAYAGRGIMGGGKGLRPDPADLHSLPRGHRAAQVFQERDAVTQLAQGGRSGIHRQTQVLGQSSKARDMVGVFVGDEHRGQLLRRDAQFLQPAGDSRVQKDMGAANGHHGGIAAGTAGQGTDFHSNSPLPGYLRIRLCSGSPAR